MQVSVYVVFEVGVTLWFPDVAFVPVNVPPLAVQDVALVEDHVSVDDPPEVMEEGEGERETVGAGGGGGVVVEPPP